MWCGLIWVSACYCCRSDLSGKKSVCSSFRISVPGCGEDARPDFHVPDWCVHGATAFNSQIKQKEGVRHFNRMFLSFYNRWHWFLVGVWTCKLFLDILICDWQIVSWPLDMSGCCHDFLAMLATGLWVVVLVFWSLLKYLNNYWLKSGKQSHISLTMNSKNITIRWTFKFAIL